MADTQNRTPLSEFLADFTSRLKAQMAQEEADAAELQRLLSEKKEGLALIQGALDRLTGSSAKSRKASKPRSQIGVRASTATAILSALSTEKPVTKAEIIEKTGLSHDTVHRGLSVLREQSKVRHAGVNGDRQAIYKLMPDMAKAD